MTGAPADGARVPAGAGTRHHEAPLSHKYYFDIN